MKKRYDSPRINKMRVVQVIILIMVLLVVEIITGFVFYNRAESVAYDGVKEGYVIDSKRIAENFDVLVTEDYKYGIHFDYLGTVDDKTITIDGHSYQIETHSVETTLKEREINFYSLAELCRDDEEDAFIKDNNIVYAVYSEKFYDGTKDIINLRFRDISHFIDEEFLSYGFESIVLFSESRRVVYSQGEVLKSYKTNVEDTNESTIVTKLGDKYYIVSMSPVGNTSYYIGGYDDFTTSQNNINSLKLQILICLIISCVITAVAVGFGFYYINAAKSFVKYSYRLILDPDGNILKSDEEFKKEFPETQVVKGQVNHFDENSSYALKFGVKNNETLLSCTVKKRSNGKIVMTANRLLTPFGSSIDTGEENKDASTETIDTLYESFIKTNKRVLLGIIFFSNLHEVKRVFGKYVSEKIHETLISKIAERFVYMYDLDQYNVGIVVPDGKDLDFILQDIPDILSKLNHVVEVDDSFIQVDVQAGFSLVDRNIKVADYDYAYKTTNAALKRAIDTTGTSYFIYNESQRKVYERYLIDIDVAKMIADGAFYLEYQPQYSIKEDRIVAFEALLRVKRHIQANLGAYDIIRYAEENGYMIALGNVIINEGMKFAKSVEDQGICISLNVSPVQLMQAGFVDNFLNIYKQYNLKPGTISIEITESFLMRQVEEMLLKLEILKNNGIEIHLDDFGVMYSSLSYLQKLPISAIKIDQGFIRDINKNNHDKFITRMIIQIAENLNLENICEGVETQEQFDTIKELGCGLVQGFFIAKSLEENAAREIIKTFHLKK